MTMQLFSFGHPCEHQLRRTCIGGSSCPLHGYPDAWCCSYVKGKINFKRDKPCEGPRCRWGFTHPTQGQFDAVTQVIAEGKAIATKLDESGPNDLLTFQIDSPHVVDTVQCALHVMKHPPSSCGKKIGQLLAYAAVKASEPKVFTQLLKTMKKPIDAYLLGANDFLLSLKTGSPPATQGTTAPAPKKSFAAGAAATKAKDDVIDDLRSDIVDVMNAALSQNGQLVVREDQGQLQQVFVAALKTFPKNRKKQEMLEAALAKFKFPPPGSSPPPPPPVIDTPELPPATPPPAQKAEKPKVEPKPQQQQSVSNAVEPSSPKKQMSAAAGSGVAASQAVPAATQPRRVVGISRCTLPAAAAAPRRYTPLAAVDASSSELLILGGLFGVSAKARALLGPASRHAAEETSPLRLLAEGVAVAAAAADSQQHAAKGSDFGSFSIFGSEPIGSQQTFSSADRSLLEGVMHAWGQ